MRRYLPYILILIVIIGLTIPSSSIYASKDNPNEACNPKTNPTNRPCESYVLLAPLPCPAGSANCTSDGKLTNFDPASGLGSYLNLMIKIFIGLCAVLSVVMIVVGGLEYMTSELSHTKEAGKERIMQAILGLLIALGAYALLFTINPDLLKSDVTIPNATVTPTVQVNPAVVTPSTQAAPLGTCTYITYNGGVSQTPITVTVTETEAQCTAGNIGTWKVNPS